MVLQNELEKNLIIQSFDMHMLPLLLAKKSKI